MINVRQRQLLKYLRTVPTKVTPPTEIRDRKKGAEDSQSCFELQRIIMNITARFITIPLEEVDKAINVALQLIGKFSGAERSYIFLANQDLTGADCAYQWCARGIKSDMGQFKGVSIKDYPWFAERVKNLKVIHVPRIEELPEDAAAEKKVLQYNKVKSFICVPMVYCEKLIGFIGFDSVRQERVWYEGTIELLKVVGEIFAHALERKRMEAQLRSGERFLASIFSSIQDGISILDKEMNIVQVNSTMERWYPHSMPLVGKKCYEAYHCKSEPCEKCPTIQTLKTGKYAYEIVPMTAAGGKIVGWISLYTFPHIDISTGELKGVIEYVRDITEQRQAQELLELERRQMLSIFESIDYPVYVSDPYTYEVLYINDAVRKLFGEAVGQKCYRVFQGLDTPCTFCSNEYIFNENIDKPYIWEFENRRNRRWYRCFDKAINWPDGRKVRCTIAIDITERKQAEEELKRLNRELTRSNRKLKQLTMRDSQTGLYNQRYLQEAIEAEFHRSRRYGYQFSVIMLDIDYFKSINDVYGYRFGNVVLKQLARQLKRIVRQYDVVIRFSGEEFVIISPGTDRATAVVLGQRILDAISLLNFGDKKNNIKLKLSVAVASYPDDKVIKGMDLIELTDQILNNAKERGGNRVTSTLDIKTVKGRILDKGVDGESLEVRLLKVKIEKLTRRANQGLVEAIFAFAKTIEVKDHCTGEHVERTVFYATEIARELNLSKDEIELVRQASMLHDLGKIGISEKILLKKSRLTTGEFKQIKRHPQIGADILRPIHFFHNLIPLILYHHERWNGNGYPYNLKGEEICVGARIVALADVYQALISDRPYRKAFPRMKAIEIIKEGSGNQFDPDIVTVFLKVLQREQ